MIEAAALLAKRSGWDDIVSVFEAAF